MSRLLIGHDVPALRLIQFTDLLSLYSDGFEMPEILSELATFTNLMLFYTSTGGSCLPSYLRGMDPRAVKDTEPAYGLQQEIAAFPAQPSFAAAELARACAMG